MVEGPLLRCGGQDASEEQDEGGQGDKAGACARVSHLFISGRRLLATGPRQTSVDGVDSSRSGRDPARAAMIHGSMRKTGMLLILTAIATVVAVVGRVSADADQPTLAASLAAIAESRGLYGLGGAGRFVSGVTLIAVAWCLFRIPSHPG